MLKVARQALDMGTDAVRILLLVEDFIRFSRRAPGEEWPNLVNFASAVEETIFERIRERECQNRPRRIEGIFLFPDLKNAEKFCAEERKGQGVILECSTTLAQTLQADMNLISNPDLTGT